MASVGPSGPPPLSALLARLRDTMQAQAEALSAEDFATLESLNAEREKLTARLDQYTPADAQPGDRELLEQLGALDQRLLAQAQAGLEQARLDLGEVHRGRTVLSEYRRRGQTLIRNLARLDVDR